MIGRMLREAGVVGMNERNFDLIQRWNPRHLFPLVDDKIRTKELCNEVGVAAPRTVGTVNRLHELSGLDAMLETEDSFVIKPARGAQGNGILVVDGRDDQGWHKASGKRVSLDDIQFRIAEILSGLFSLAGQVDRALIEECLRVHPALESVSKGGVPDLRLIVYRGYPLMAMLRLPTTMADGRANLHQGAVGVGISIADGTPRSAVLKDRFVERHPDTGVPLMDIRIPGFATLLSRATRAAQATGLEYVGVDMVIDSERGPVVLELNARPGLSIQLANQMGLTHGITTIDGLARENPDADALERIAAIRGESMRAIA